MKLFNPLLVAAAVAGGALAGELSTSDREADAHGEGSGTHYAFCIKGYHYSDRYSGYRYASTTALGPAERTPGWNECSSVRANIQVPLPGTSSAKLPFCPTTTGVFDVTIMNGGTPVVGYLTAQTSIYMQGTPFHRATDDNSGSFHMGQEPGGRTDQFVNFHCAGK